MNKNKLILLMLTIQNTPLICMETNLNSELPSEEMMKIVDTFLNLQPDQLSQLLPVRNEAPPATPPLHCNKLDESKQDEPTIDARKQTSIKITLRRTITGYQCQAPDCRKVFNTDRELQKHNARMHQTEKPFECDEADCSQCYSTKSSLALHKIRIHRDKIYECSICPGRKYAIKGDLNNHFKRKHRHQLLAALKKPKVALQE